MGLPQWLREDDPYPYPYPSPYPYPYPSPSPCPCVYVRMIPALSYAGIVSAFTAGIIILGYTRGGAVSATDYSMARIEMTCYGVAVWLLISRVVSPLDESQP